MLTVEELNKQVRKNYDDATREWERNSGPFTSIVRALGGEKYLNGLGIHCRYALERDEFYFDYAKPNEMVE